MTFSECNQSIVMEKKNFFTKEERESSFFGKTIKKRSEINQRTILNGDSEETTLKGFYLRTRDKGID